MPRIDHGMPGIYESSPTTISDGEGSGLLTDNYKRLVQSPRSTSGAVSTVSGTVTATNAAGGTQIVSANTNRRFTQCQNNGSVDVYFGTGTVTSSFLKVVPGGTFSWLSQEALKVLSSGADCSIGYCDYLNV